MFDKLKDILKCNEIKPLETYTDYNLVESSSKSYILDVVPTDVIVGKDVMNDLEVFHPYDNESFQSTVFHVFQKNCSTEGGRTFVKNLLNNPINNIIHLENRKACFQKLSNIHLDEYTHLKEELKKTEKDFLWFFSQKEKTVDELLNSIYFSSYWILNNFNNSPSFMTSYNFYKIILSPMIGILSPLIYFIIPFIILKIKFGKIFQMSFTTYVKMLYKSMTMSNNLINLLDNNNGNSMLSRLQMITYVLSLVFYFQGMFNTVSVSRTTYKIVEYISVKVNHAFIYLKACCSLNDKVWNDILYQFDTDFITNKLDDVDNDFLKLLSEYKPFEKFSVFSHFGDQLVKYKKFNTTDVLNIVNKTYMVDGLFAIMYVKHHFNLSFVDYVINSDTPFVTSKKAWHLCVNKDISVKNDIVFKNAIITGPNAGGKSTLIKTLCLNVLLSQTITLSASEHTEMTPFYFINTQINIPDCKGIESLFEAEMNRCLYTLSVIKENPNKKCLIVMDEIFNSTNLVEAIAGAYSILQKLNDFENVMTIVTTHFVYLTKLKKHTSFQCYKMNVICDSNSEKIIFPYILSKGVSKQYVALELLRERGFDDSIINNALTVKNKLTKRV